MLEAMRQMVGVFAQLEKNIIVRRLQSGRKAKRAQGGYMGGRTCPFGLQVQGEGREAHFVPGEQAPVVARIFQDYAAGTSTNKIAAGLAAQGIKGSRGGRIAQQQVANILRNDLYVKTGLVTAEAFEVCRQRLQGTAG